MRWLRSPPLALALVVTLSPAGLVIADEPARPEASGAEAVSLLGKPLAAPELPRKFRSQQRKLLKKALGDLGERPNDPEAVIWVGRRTAYLGRYREAIRIYSQGIAAHPDHPGLRRHRGHRYLTLRRLDEAIVDLERAGELITGRDDEIEPDGLPNARNIPTSTLHTNIWYHLGLAYYLKGDLWKARSAYEKCLAAAKNPDMVVATTHWLYMTLRRLPRHRHALWALRTMRADMDIIENHDYHQLLMVYKGKADAETLLAEAEKAGGVRFATIGYGLGNWFLAQGDSERARQVFTAVEAADAWSAFGHLAAESDLARWPEAP